MAGSLLPSESPFKDIDFTLATAYLLACLLACLPACLLACLLACLQFFFSTPLPTPPAPTSQTKYRVRENENSRGIMCLFVCVF